MAIFKTCRACENGVNAVVTSTGQRQKSESSTGVRPGVAQIPVGSTMSKVIEKEGVICLLHATRCCIGHEG